jgi:asparagine synthase (glutamine-hydrolysing)
MLKKPLPQEVIRRPKSGFSVPVREWMQETPDRGLRHWARYVYAQLWKPSSVQMMDASVTGDVLEPPNAA